MSGQARSIVAVPAGLSQPSSTRLLADRLVAATERSLSDRGVEVTTEVVELRHLAQDLVNNLLTGFPSERLRETIERVLAADGLVAVSPIFSASYSGLFKMFFGVVERDRLAGMPVLLAATGGTARHSLALEHALRPLFAYFGAATVPTAVFAAAEDWGQADRPADIGLRERIERASSELAAAVAARSAPAIRDEFEDPIPFEEMLRGG